MKIKINMSLLIIGDSNARQTLEENQADIERFFKDDLTFEQAGTNEAVEIVLDGTVAANCSRIVIATILNEVAAKCKTAKSRDENVDIIAKKQIETVINFLKEHENIHITIVGPMLRQDPIWIADKIRLVSLSLKDHVTNAGLSNLTYAEGCKITESELAQDKVHLTSEGKEKYIQYLSGIASTTLEEDDSTQSSMNWSQTPTPTPTISRFNLRSNLRSSNKRIRNVSASEDEATVTKRGKTTDLDIIMSELRSMRKDMINERAAAVEKTEEIVAKLNVNIQTSSNNSKKIETIEKKVASSGLSIALMKEDLDAVENERLRDIVLVRRLKSESRMPAKKNELNEVLKPIVLKLLSDLGVAEDELKFFALAYSSLDPKKQASRPGQVPAFKIGFKTKETGIKFKDAGAKASKDATSNLYKVGFTHQQCSGSRIRSAVMWAIVNKLKEEGKEAWVNSATNKPRLQIKTTEKFPKDYTYIEAVNEFGQKLTKKDLKDLNDQARKFFKGQVEQVFVILKD